MATEIRVPTLGESVSEATIGRWFKKPGDAVKADEPLVELETDKVTLEVNAPAAGTLGDISAKDGETVTPGALLGSIVEGAGASASASAKAAEAPKAEFGRRPRRRCGQRQGRTDHERRHARRHRARHVHRTCRGSVSACPGARALRAGRRVARRARAHDQAAPDDRAALEGRPEHRRHADDVQRRRHGRGDASPQSIQGRVREEARREARLHGLLHQGLRPGPEGHPGGERRDRRPGYRLQELLPRRHRGRHREGTCRPGGARRGPALRRRHREDDRRVRQARPRRAAHDRGDAARHVHDHQRRHLRLADVDADPQRATVRHSGHAPHRGAAGGAGRQDRAAADDVPRLVLRSPHRRRQGGRDRSWCGSRRRWRTRRGWCWIYRS